MRNAVGILQLYLRLGLGFAFLMPVADCLGWLGLAGQKGVSWGNWEKFVAYTNMLLPFLSHQMANVMALFATIFEILIGTCLIVGFKTRIVAYSSALLTLIFMLCVLVLKGAKAPFNYAVFLRWAAGLLLAFAPVYYWSFDDGF